MIKGYEMGDVIKAHDFVHTKGTEILIFFRINDLALFLSLSKKCCGVVRIHGDSIFMVFVVALTQEFIS